MHVPFVILAALQEEADVILQAAQSARSTKATFGLSQSYLIKAHNVRAKGVLVVLSGMGRLHAATAAIQAISKWRPKFILIAGIAGGFRRKELRLGDVLVATSILDYEQQKVASTTRRIRWHNYPADSRLLNIAYQAARSPGCLGERSGDNTPQVHFGPALSGDKIVASQGFVDHLLSGARDAMGIEMEGAGVAFAANQYSVPMLMIRGIADFADECKREQMEQWRAVACNTAAMFVFSFLRVGGSNWPDNGLSVAENRELFETRKIERVVELIIRGLSRRFSQVS